MTVSAAGFYIVAALLLAATTAAVVLPRLRHSGAAAALALALVGLLAIISGAYALGVVQLLVAGILVATFALTLLRREPYCRIAPSSPATSMRWWIGAAVAGGFALLFAVSFALSADGFSVGSSVARLITVLHYRAPYALVIALVLVVTAVSVAFMLGRTSQDERELDRSEEERRQREERVRRRREDRLAARGRSPASGPQE
jgi:lysylphosphatidylglycerol synthetase-like protein (DUF2156 family)